MNPDPFGALGLPARPDLSDDDVRAAWRRVAAATHPDRADGGDPSRFAEAAAAYTELRTRYGRGEAYADLAAGTRRHSPTRARAKPPTGADAPDTAAPTRVSRSARPVPASWVTRGRPVMTGLASRVARGRPVVLAVRLALSAGIVAVAFLVAGTQPAAAGLATGVITWLLVTVRHDLAPPS